MKQIIRSFALGLLTAGIIMLGTFYFAGGSQADADDIATDDMIKHIKQEGYHVLTESEYIDASVKSDNDSNADKQDQDGDAKDKSKDDAKTYTLKVTSGTATSEISEELEEHGIIENAQKFSDYLEDEGYSEQIQLGKSNLSGDMDRKKIAETLTD
ncbi:hypothetical protein GCM10028778_09530 [Barrientosiimonas marina]|uniref:YceG-like family protein n=1 Tax=Lentibacillus kimchii TaxID=1542911 RepID=A0ABW2UXT4_9BACI